MKKSTSGSPTSASPSGVVSNGLEGVVVAETMLARVDGERGRLLIRGCDLETVAGRTSFEAMCNLLWLGRHDDESANRELKSSLGADRVRAFASLPRLGTALEARDGMEALRAALAHLPGGSPENEEHERTGIVAATATFCAAWARRCKGLDPIAPDPELGHAEDLLRMVTGERGSSAHRQALDTYLSTVAEHGMAASTFAARVVASTGSDTVSAVVGALGALKGPLHGGAPGPVLDMLDGVGTHEGARPWLERELSEGRRIMGLGHRIYRVRDPRAAVLEQAIESLEEAGISTPRLELARRVEREAAALLRERYPDRALETNVEFYTAVLLDALGFERSVFTPVFATARVAGWIAHIEEQRRTGRIIRPKAHYVGPLPEAA